MAFEIQSSSIPPIISDQTPATPTFTGPFASGQNVAVTLKQIGKLVIMEVAGISAAGAAVSASTVTGLIPAALRPAAQVFGPVIITSNSVILPAAGRCSVNTSGDVTINADLLGTLAWSAIGNNGWSRFSLSWTIS